MKYWLLLTLILLNPVSAGQFCGAQSAMGRWVPDEFSTPMSRKNAHFARACSAHDLCYQTAGVNRTFCDIQFEQNLRYECDLAYPDGFDIPSKMACYGAANGFGIIVRQFGEPYFKHSQENAVLFFWRQ